MKNELTLDALKVKELSFNEVRKTDGGFLPMAVIGVCWGVMAISSAVALGMRSAAKDNGANIW